MGTLVLKQIIDCKTCILPLQNLVQITYDLGFKNIDIGILNLRFFYGFSRDRRCFTIFESIELVFI